MGFEINVHISRVSFESKTWVRSSQQHTWSVPRGIEIASHLSTNKSPPFWRNFNALTTCISLIVNIKIKLINLHQKEKGSLNQTNKNGLTRSNGKKNADALEGLQPAFKATAVPSRLMTGEPLEPPFVPEAAYREKNYA